MNSKLTVGTIKVGDAKNVSRAALCSTGEARAAQSNLALLDECRRGHSDCGTGEESDGSEELHVD